MPKSSLARGNGTRQRLWRGESQNRLWMGSGLMKKILSPAGLRRLADEGVAVRPGEQLKERRSRLGITTRDVTEKSQRIAEAEGNDEFCISNAWLTQIENTDATPSIYKLYSISTIYHVKFTDLLLLFGVDLQKIGRDQIAMLKTRRSRFVPNGRQPSE